ncbi:predicted protein [Nematostella vectensis]|uniref:Uncharacterized protein n=2 Tax=Nematostella vectensis TaxID=45351 RepID=A7SFN2_NEMVE|nr:predicted protein [Nematostella vectensis]|eukprot:XP_001629559.1 predicted protein [Nematostella vectensis]
MATRLPFVRGRLLHVCKLYSTHGARLSSTMSSEPPKIQPGTARPKIPSGFAEKAAQTGVDKTRIGTEQIGSEQIGSEYGDDRKFRNVSGDDNKTYMNEEYFSYNQDSFYDIEMVIDATGARQKQPDPKVPYQHTEPWNKAAKA